jgi:putative transposase
MKVSERRACWVLGQHRTALETRGLKVPHKQPKKGRLWLNDGSCVRLRPEYCNHVWSYDFVYHRTDDGRAFRTLNILDEHSRECLAIRVKRKLKATEFIAEAVRGWITAVGTKTAFNELGSPWENGYCKSFNGRMRDELLNGDIFYSLREAQIIIESWNLSGHCYAIPCRSVENTTTPNDPIVLWAIALPAPKNIIPIETRPIMHKQSTWTT